ncbi:tyrosine-type recombinase/integrase [Caenimonas sedimenti]|uniref:Tyrosine-type recombinase/integrase n=1 Tax=Caenimonas sedimenti TaxID=2596921 RepID=A0A562ZSE6_9BURK|nr:phage integrase family protein [Caenimonas sedimenti]TWO71509.1 tyrosine-type recombinase/integrase [Caenimonas sedimenti]
MASDPLQPAAITDIADIAAAPSAARGPRAGTPEPRDPQRWRTVVFDAEDEAPDGAPRKPKRGRPRGSLGALVASHAPITADDFRFLSAMAQGVDPRQAARTYLLHNLHQDGRGALGYARGLLARLGMAAHNHPDAGAATALVRELQRRLAKLLRPPRRGPAAASAPAPDQVVDVVPHAPGSAPAPAVPPQAAVRPSLEDFAARFDDGMYGEAELIALYHEEFGAEPGPGEVSAQAAPAPATEEARAGQGAPSGHAAPRVPHKELFQLDVLRRLEILEWLAPRLAVPLRPDSPLTDWVEPSLAQQLRGHGLTTLGQLATWVNVQGSQFHRRVAGFGPRRARRLLLWLVEREQILGVTLRGPLKELVGPVLPLAIAYVDAPALPLQARRDGDPAGPAASQQLVPSLVPAPLPPLPPRGPRFALVPLEQLAWPDALAGHDGLLRAPGANYLLWADGRAAQDDREALRHFLEVYVGQRRSKHTQRSYRSALQRFVLWALVERGKALSSMVDADFYAFRDFLLTPPAHWCSDSRVMKHSDEWRPLRGALSGDAVRLNLRIVQLMYGWWHRRGYLRVNLAADLQLEAPDHAVESGSADAAAGEGAAEFDAGRSFAREDLQAMERAFQRLPESAGQRRLGAILSLFLESGVRRSEVQHLTLGGLAPLRDDANSLSAVQKLKVLGKRRKEREIPVLAGTMAALEAHHRDRRLLIAAGKLPAHWGALERKDTPILSVLQAPQGKLRSRRGVSPASADRTPSFDGRLDAKTLYGILKKFFAKVAEQIAAEGGGVAGQADFRQASTHWLRHTFALQYLAANPGDLPGLQGLLGHSKLNTTGIYSRFGLAHRQQGLERMDKFAWSLTGKDQQ